MIELTRSGSGTDGTIHKNNGVNSSHYDMSEHLCKLKEDVIFHHRDMHPKNKLQRDTGIEDGMPWTRTIDKQCMFLSSSIVVAV